MSKIECPYKEAGICMNTVSMHYDESCCPGYCLFYRHLGKNGEVEKVNPKVQLKP